MRVIVGLGNPGLAYRHHRHNLGFQVVEELARRRDLVFRDDGSACAVAGNDLSTGGLVLVKPLTYMNRSGEAVRAWSRTSGVVLTGCPAPPDVESTEFDDTTDSPLFASPEAVRPLVVCDDLNLTLGSVRLRPNGSSGGQNGLASLVEHLQGEEFPRMRLGIAPLEGVLDPEDWADFVLADFEPGELAAAEEMVDHAATALEFWLDHGLEPAISRFNRRIRLKEE